MHRYYNTCYSIYDKCTCKTAWTSDCLDMDSPDVIDLTLK